MSGNLPKGCDDSIDADLDPGRSIKIVPEGNYQMLTEKQIVDYHSYRRTFLEWLLYLGKNPEKAEGYSPYTVYESGYRAAAFDRGCGNNTTNTTFLQNQKTLTAIWKP